MQERLDKWTTAVCVLMFCESIVFGKGGFHSALRVLLVCVPL